jgi:hypothetical protein
LVVTAEGKSLKVSIVQISPVASSTKTCELSRLATRETGVVKAELRVAGDTGGLVEKSTVLILDTVPSPFTT